MRLRWRNVSRRSLRRTSRSVLYNPFRKHALGLPGRCGPLVDLLGIPSAFPHHFRSLFNYSPLALCLSLHLLDSRLVRFIHELSAALPTKACMHCRWNDMEIVNKASGRRPCSSSRGTAILLQEGNSVGIATTIIHLPCISTNGTCCLVHVRWLCMFVFFSLIYSRR